MKANPRMNRWTVTLAGIAASLGPGALYSYGLFASALEAAFNWTPIEMATGFGIAIFAFSLGSLVGGAFTDRFGPRYIAIAGSLLWGAGNVLFGTLAPSLGLLALFGCYAALGGFGAGMVCIAAVETIMKLFPSRRGFGSGLVTMGFSLGAFVYNTIAVRLTSITTIIQNAGTYLTARDAAVKAFKPFHADTYLLTASQVGDLLHIFVMSGIVFAVLGAVVCVFLPSAAAPDESGIPAVTPGQMLTRPQYYILWATLLLNALAGVIVVDNSQIIMQELTGEAPDVVAATFGWLILFGALGQFFWGYISDRYGRRAIFSVIFSLQVVAFFALVFTHTLVIAAVLFALVLFCYAGGFSMMPAYNSDYFGLKHIGANYGLNVTAWGIADLIGTPLMQGIRGVTGSYAGALEPTAILLCVAIIFPIISESVVQKRLTTASATA
jgi:OFA family oxalate/formate antiporter-like MFS transporter